MEMCLFQQGRLGNAIFRYLASIIVSIVSKQDYNLTLIHNKKSKSINDEQFLSIEHNIKQYLNQNIYLTGYYQHDSIYLKYKKEIISYMELHPDHVIGTDGNDEKEKRYVYNKTYYNIKDIIHTPPKFNKYYDIAIHLRLEDFITYGFYIKVEKIIDLLQKIKLSSNVCIVIKKIKTETENEYIEKINTFYNTKYNKNIIVESNSVIEDFHIMKNAKTLICSMSTLSWCASLLSDKLETCYMPDYKPNAPGTGKYTSFRKPIENTIFYSM
jgi:hypothetical protein